MGIRCEVNMDQNIQENNEKRWESGVRLNKELKTRGNEEI